MRHVHLSGLIRENSRPRITDGRVINSHNARLMLLFKRQADKKRPLYLVRAYLFIVWRLNRRGRLRVVICENIVPSKLGDSQFECWFNDKLMTNDEGNNGAPPENNETNCSFKFFVKYILIIIISILQVMKVREINLNDLYCHSTLLNRSFSHLHFPILVSKTMPC